LLSVDGKDICSSELGGGSSVATGVVSVYDDFALPGAEFSYISISI